MARILVHVTHGPENPTPAALAFLVAKTAIDEGKPAEFAQPNVLIRLSLDHDRMFTY